ncbi:MAG: DUF4426 domain-containing protein [Gammaproteobacteria bacterium]|nr:MAG: DUF4426 domain-containing protein [Gammaproteobacteria bacterium]
MRRVALLFLMVVAALVYAEHPNQKTIGDVVIHYNVFNASQLSPDVARQYGISRSGNYGVVNVSVRKGKPGDDKPLRASVKGFARNLLSQVKSLDFREIEEKGAIYYIATFRFDNEERLKFELQVQPEGMSSPVAIKFENQFYNP